MSHNHPPTQALELALWLLGCLTNQEEIEGGLIEGVLPTICDFDEVERAIREAGFGGVCSATKRSIEFNPTIGGVYASLADLLKNKANLSTPPSRFHLRDIGYTYSGNSQPDNSVQQYITACELWKLLRNVADYAEDSVDRLTFMQSPSQRLDIILAYDASDLSELEDTTPFTRGFMDSSTHQEQKRIIVRTVLIEMWGATKKISFSDLIGKFPEFMSRVKSGYSMYVAEFSFERVKAEVEKDNLDSTLKLNKTFSDMQNQLLALPVTLLLVGGQMVPNDGLSLKNLFVWLGSLAFSILMWLLIHNQHGALQSINEEISLRKKKLSSQPKDNQAQIIDIFSTLDVRYTKQKIMLSYVRAMVWVSFLLSTGLLLWYAYPCQIKTGIAFIQSIFC